MNHEVNQANVWIPRILSIFAVTGVVLFFLPSTNQTALGQGNESALHDMRSQEEITSGTLILKSAVTEIEQGVVTFEMMSETKLNSTPPPIFIESVEALDGTEVTIRGFMTPYDSLTEFDKFMIFPSATGCQFCAVPSPKEVVFVRLKNGEGQEFISAPIEVKGKLSLWKEGRDKEDEAHKSFLFVINDATVKTIKG